MLQNGTQSVHFHFSAYVLSVYATLEQVTVVRPPLGATQASFQQPAAPPPVVHAESESTYGPYGLVAPLTQAATALAFSVPATQRRPLVATGSIAPLPPSALLRLSTALYELVVSHAAGALRHSQRCDIVHVSGRRSVGSSVCV
jgi:hypothetical protein